MNLRGQERKKKIFECDVGRPVRSAHVTHSKKKDENGR